DARTVTLDDNGVGMSRDEVVENLGTIARSGTREFLSNLSGDQAKDATLIGQFGVGFYSAFVVADRVVVDTRRAGADAAVRWASDGKGEFELGQGERAGRGTAVTLHLKDDESEFLDAYRLRSVIKKYSDHISVPVQMQAQAPAATDDEGEGEAKADDAEPTFETVNHAAALWTRPKQDISDEEYSEFYKHVAHDFEDPLAWTHSRVEGRQEYTSLLYVPGRAPFDLFDMNRSHGVKLFVQRVFIMDDAEQMMPRYLRFVRGVIDSNDLPLNVSRELLQSSRIVEGIKNGSVKKILTLLEGMARDDADKYAMFWTQFGQVLKEGLGEDHANRERLAKLLRFASTAGEGDAQTVSLEDYVGRMKAGQDKIFFVTAETHAAASNSPQLEYFRSRDIEVLLLSDRVDEWLVAHLPEFDGKALVSVTRGDLDLGDIETADEKERQKQMEEQHRDFVARVQSILREQVSDVKVSHRLTDSPSCVVAGEGGLGSNLERILREAGQAVPDSKPVLELNPVHPIVIKLTAEKDKERFATWSQLLLYLAVLAVGGLVDAPAATVRRFNDMIVALDG
ncbi:MAG: molecular chaperone HtpG, partial [Pseudomonadota bacterium]